MTIEETIKAVVAKAIQSYAPPEAKEYKVDKIKLSLKEAGELLGYSYPTMLELANREDFPAFKCMGKWIIPYDKLIEWLHTQTSKAGR
jgi:predicted DNA-binding transcriptional regulator AlpA